MDINLLRYAKLHGLEAARMGALVLDVANGRTGYGVFYGVPSTPGFREQWVRTKKEATALMEQWAEEIKVAGHWTTGRSIWRIYVGDHCVAAGPYSAISEAVALQANLQEFNSRTYVALEHETLPVA